jgi:uncharacterized alkaline shock family protein YloU
VVLWDRAWMGCPSRTGANGAVEYHTASDAQVRTRPTRTREEDVARVPSDPIPGRSLVTRRAVADIVRTAVLGSYGVTGFAASLPERLLARLGWATPGLDVSVGDGVRVELDLTVAYGVPIAEVGRQVDSAVRYGLRRALGLEVSRLVIHIDGLRFAPAGSPPGVSQDASSAVRPGDLADSGTDVA